MASWLQSQLKAAEDLLHAVDRTAKSVSVAQAQGKPVQDERPRPQGAASGPSFRQERQAGAAVPGPPRAADAGSTPASRSSSFAEGSADRGSGTSAAPAAPARQQAAAAPAERAPESQATPSAAAAPRRSLDAPAGGSGAVQPLGGSAGPPASSEPAVHAPGASALPAAQAAAAAAADGAAQQSSGSPSGPGSTEAGVGPQPAALPEPGAAGGQHAEQDAERDAAHQAGAAPAHEPLASAAAPVMPPAPTGEEPRPHASAPAAAEEGGGGSPELQSQQHLQSQELQPSASMGEAEAGGEGGLRRIEQELDEARGLAGDAATQRELRLQKVVERLKQRLEQYRAENEQLEEMLQVADAKAQGGSGEIERLEDEVARAQAARISAEAALQHALMAKEGEVRSLKEQLKEATAKLSGLEGQLQELHEANDTLVAERKVSEGQLIQTLRKEVEGIEQVLEEERAAHAATRKAAAAREHELESSLQDSASSMARMQREVEERSAKLAAVEERCAALEHEVDALSHSLRTTEGKLQKQVELAQQSSSEALQARIAELEAALLAERGATAAAEQGRAAADEELVRLRAEVGSLKRQLAETSSLDTGDLQRRLKEVTDLLYLKQTQLERIASEKAAQQLQLERELAQAKAEAEQVKRRARTDRAIAAAEDAVVPMDTIGDAYHRLANNNRVGGAVKAGARFLDASASQVVRILRQYPVGRLVVFAYFLGVHLFIYILLHRLQRRAFRAELASGAGDLESIHEQLAG